MGSRLGGTHSNQASQNDFAKQVSARHIYFLNRIKPSWNALPKKIVQAPTLNIFKRNLRTDNLRTSKPSY